MFDRTGILLLVSGPSGSGKSTLCHRLIEEDSQTHFSISCTTRAPREGEIDGKDYHFLSPEEFSQRVDQGDFLEHATVHGNFYGTLKSEVLSFLSQGIDVVMDIDVQGAEKVRTHSESKIQKALVDLFVMPPSEEELRDRLTGRQTDDPAVIEKRMKNSLAEMAQWPKFRNLLVSGTRESDYTRFHSLLTAERMNSSRILSS